MEERRWCSYLLLNINNYQNIYEKKWSWKNEKASQFLSPTSSSHSQCKLFYIQFLHSRLTSTVYLLTHSCRSLPLGVRESSARIRFIWRRSRCTGPQVSYTASPATTIPILQHFTRDTSSLCLEDITLSTACEVRMRVMCTLWLLTDCNLFTLNNKISIELIIDITSFICKS